MMDELKPVQHAIESGHIELARNLLRVLIESHPHDADVWYWAAQAAVNDAQRKAFLEKAVTLDPLHHRAANHLMRLERGDDPLPPPTSSPQSQSAASQSAVAIASLDRRALAVFIDFVITGVIAIPFLVPVISLQATDAPMTMTALIDNPALYASTFTIITLIQVIYNGYFLSQRNGQTPGKRLAGIRVVKRNGTPISIWDAILRNVIGYRLSNFILGAGFLWSLSNPERRTWHDFVVDTLVVEA